MLGVALATTVLAAPVAAQDETAPPDESLAPAVCDILTAEDVSAALGETLTLADGTGIACQFDADYEALRFLSLFTSLTEDTSREDLVGFLCSASETPAPSAVPCGQEVPVGSSTGSYFPDAFGSMLYLDIGNGDLLAMQLVGEPLEGVDKLEALTTLGALALPRVGDVPAPTSEPTETAAALERDDELAALFPADIAGSPLTIETRRGESALVDTEADIKQLMLDALAAQGKSVEDLSIGFGFSDDGSVQIIALRIRGADVRPAVGSLLGAFTNGPVPSMTPQGVAAGKDVSSITQDGEQVYVYPKDDILWLVVADDAPLIETFARLP
jgi:hypothetical protein